MFRMCDNFYVFYHFYVFSVYIYGVLLQSNISIQLFTKDEPVLLLCLSDFICIIAITEYN